MVLVDLLDLLVMLGKVEKEVEARVIVAVVARAQRAQFQIHQT